jgi:hypothetical protein
MDIKPIETYYNGYRFRSRLEARWAVLFDTLGIPYQYEPQGFQLSDGTYYLPDFYLPTLDVWVEVKGVMTDADMHKIEQFRNDRGDRMQREGMLWVVGQIPNEEQAKDTCIAYNYKEFEYPIFSVDWDHPYLLCTCPVCGKIGIEFDGRGDRVCGTKCTGDDDKGYTSDHPKILNAYKTARQARFEHGEQPIINKF